MAAANSERHRKYVRAAARLALLSIALLFLSLLLLQVTAGSVSASYHTEAASQHPAVPLQTDTPTDTPADTSTDTPTEIPTETVPTATSPAVVSATSTAVPTNTPADNGSGAGGSANPGTTAGPQPTKVVLTQPTASDGSGGALQGMSPSNFGTNGLLIATTLGCVVALLGIVIGAFSLRALILSGYGPFLRALLRGNRSKDQTGRKAASGRPRTRTGYDDRQGSAGSYRGRSDYAGRLPPPPRGPRQSRPGEYSGDRNRP